LDLVQNEDGSRVASCWRVTGRNNGLMGTEPNDAPFRNDRHRGVGNW
jgi:hypothetical protein